jgi:hypothetical protein
MLTFVSAANGYEAMDLEFQKANEEPFYQIGLCLTQVMLVNQASSLSTWQTSHFLPHMDLPFMLIYCTEYADHEVTSFQCAFRDR